MALNTLLVIVWKTTIWDSTLPPPIMLSPKSYNFGHNYKGVWVAYKISHEQRIISWTRKMRFLGLLAMIDLSSVIWKTLI
jgi:hypothetical protein